MKPFKQEDVNTNQEKLCFEPDADKRNENAVTYLAVNEPSCTRDDLQEKACEDTTSSKVSKENAAQKPYGKKLNAKLQRAKLNDYWNNEEFRSLYGKGGRRRTGSIASMESTSLEQHESQQKNKTIDESEAVNTSVASLNNAVLFPTQNADQLDSTDISRENNSSISTLSTQDSTINTPETFNSRRENSGVTTAYTSLTQQTTTVIVLDSDEAAADEDYIVEHRSIEPQEIKSAQPHVLSDNMPQVNLQGDTVSSLEKTAPTAETRHTKTDAISNLKRARQSTCNYEARSDRLEASLMAPTKAANNKLAEQADSNSTETPRAKPAANCTLGTAKVFPNVEPEVLLSRMKTVPTKLNDRVPFNLKSSGNVNLETPRTNATAKSRPTANTVTCITRNRSKSALKDKQKPAPSCAQDISTKEIIVIDGDTISNSPYEIETIENRHGRQELGESSSTAAFCHQNNVPSYLIIDLTKEPDEVDSESSQSSSTLPNCLQTRMPRSEKKIQIKCNSRENAHGTKRSETSTQNIGEASISRCQSATIPRNISSSSSSSDRSVSGTLHKQDKAVSVDDQELGTGCSSVLQVEQPKALRHLLENRNSFLAEADLRALIPHLLKSLPAAQTAELAKLLPPPDVVAVEKNASLAINPEFTSVSNNFFWEAADKWQQILKMGGFDQDNIQKRHKLQTQQPTKANDSFKDDNYEEYWGERLERNKSEKKNDLSRVKGKEKAKDH
ncbi:hypothetical protein [Parasitella parasitica]|uniref:ASX DEUBAD domain-containing protein n=1 Tax=Parasitella parasitica TaxID=35722 RepID=A0A0B7NC47_9FUNG|nr:hypothetical protein [Parasitella parasitica]